MMSSAAPQTITLILRGYLSRRYQGSKHTEMLPLAVARTPRAALTHLGISPGAVGLVFVNQQQAGLDTPLSHDDVVEILPLLGGG